MRLSEEWTPIEVVVDIVLASTWTRNNLRVGKTMFRHEKKDE